jgi:hypothetical protein
MKIVNRDDLKKYDCIYSDTPDSVWYVSHEVSEGGLKGIRKFDSPTSGLNRVFNSLDSKWRMILEALDYDTSGKRILELGCGAESGNAESLEYGADYFPWLGRFMHLTKEKTGLEYVGVDSGDVLGEIFPCRQLDLLDKGSLIAEFPENHFDIAVAFMLFNSPELQRKIYGDYYGDAFYECGEKLAESVIPQLENIVKPDGSFLWYGGTSSLLDIYKS